MVLDKDDYFVEANGQLSESVTYWLLPDNPTGTYNHALPQITGLPPKTSPSSIPLILVILFSTSYLISTFKNIREFADIYSAIAQNTLDNRHCILFDNITVMLELQLL